MLSNVDSSGQCPSNECNGEDSPNEREKEDCEYCGPDATKLLAFELRYATDFWSRHVRPWTQGFFRFRWYLGFVRWKHMLLIGPQLDWTDLSSPLFQAKEDGTKTFCPTKECRGTYEICQTCVHDHFIGNLMYGFWARLHGIHDSVTDLAGHLLQLFGDTTSRGLDKPWDKAGYELGRILAAYNNGGVPMTANRICAIMKGSHYFALANRTGEDYSHCEFCPRGLDGGIENWAKKFQNPGTGGYAPF